MISIALYQGDSMGTLPNPECLDDRQIAARGAMLLSSDDCWCPGSDSRLAEEDSCPRPFSGFRRLLRCADSWLPTSPETAESTLGDRTSKANQFAPECIDSGSLYGFSMIVIAARSRANKAIKHLEER